LFVWAVSGALLTGVSGLVIATAQQSQGPVFIAGDRPVTEDQVREKLQSDGWSNMHFVHDGQYFRIVASKDGQTDRITVDSQTGRLGAEDDDDDDDDDDK
jgi:hypothetical protein